MKSHPLAYLACICLASCQTSSYQDEVVSETYVHRYGVPLDPVDWSARGRHGQVVSTLKDGVVVARTYDSGVLHGETSYTYPHSDFTHKREVYDRGQLKQEMWYYESGGPHQQIEYIGDDRHTMINWYENGVPQAKEEYERQHLLQGEYYTISNQVESRVNDGQGTRTQRDGYGQLISIDAIENGQMVQSTMYHANGAPASIMSYVNGTAQGQKRTFLPGGEPHTIEEWKNGYQHGNTIVFQNGAKYADVPYRYGQKHGMEKRYRDEIALVEEISWVENQRHGPTYSHVGNEQKTTWYVQGKPATKAMYDAYEHQK
jgi:antitoxin component YwqK of YwqJK toxin-antitoxin module